MNRLTWIAPIVFIAVMLGGVGVAQATGAWITSGKQVVAVGQLADDDVKGSMTLQQAADGLGMTFADLVTLINPPDPSLLTPSTAFKDLEASVPGFELTTFRETLRTYLAARNGTPIPTPTTVPSVVAPSPPVVTSSSPSPTATHTATAQATGTGTGDASIKGSMTLRQVAEANQLQVAVLVAECGLPADVNADLTLRELADSIPGFDVQIVKDAVARLR
ncbi:MAG TPA: hypothetical protein VIK31_07690 [Propionibacteriaceae bacterium]